MWKSSSGGRLSNLILGMRLGVVVQVVLRLVKFILRFSQSGRLMLPAQTVCEYLWKCSHASSLTWRPAPSGAWNCLDASLEHHSRPVFQKGPALATQKLETITNVKIPWVLAFWLLWRFHAGPLAVTVLTSVKYHSFCPTKTANYQKVLFYCSKNQPTKTNWANF